MRIHRAVMKASFRSQFKCHFLRKIFCKSWNYIKILHPVTLSSQFIRWVSEWNGFRMVFDAVFGASLNRPGSTSFWDPFHYLNNRFVPCLTFFAVWTSSAPSVFHCRSKHQHGLYCPKATFHGSVWFKLVLNRMEFKAWGRKESLTEGQLWMKGARDGNNDRKSI